MRIPVVVGRASTLDPCAPSFQNVEVDGHGKGQVRVLKRLVAGAFLPSLLVLCALPSAAAERRRGGRPGGAPMSAPPSRERGIRVMLSPKSYRRGKMFSKDDPVPAFGKGDVELFKGGLTTSEIKQLLDGYLGRMLMHYAAEHGFSPRLVEFLVGNKLAKEVFVSALDPRYDDIAKAAEVFESLLGEGTAARRKLEQYVHLATAIAVVFDTPDAVASSRYTNLWMVEESQFKPLPDYRANWDYYTDPRLVSRFGFALPRLPWPILVHLVDNGVPQDERRWSLKHYSARGSIASLYSKVPYDYKKLERTGSKLGSKPYTLENVLRNGGVCVDQAHFSSRVAKCLGVPAMKVSGHGRYGGMGHAWTGYLVIEKGRPLLKFTGRYFFDYYYTGDVFDPQTRTHTLDRYVAMMYDGASLSYPKYNQSQMLVRMAEKIADEHPAESLQLVQEALKLNYFNMWGWPLLMEHVRAGTLPKKEGLEWFNRMLVGLRGHPDMTFACLGAFLECVPKESVKQRQSLLNQAAALYGAGPGRGKQAARPDLLLKLRKVQADELVAAGLKRQALVLLVSTIVQNAKQAKLVLPATRTAVELATELGLQGIVYKELRKADSAFPKTRGATPSEAYQEFKDLLDQLK